MNKLKKCTKCGGEFPHTSEFFHKRKEGRLGLKSTCKDCSNKKNREYRKNNSEKLRKRSRELERERRKDPIYRKMINKRNLDRINNTPGVRSQINDRQRQAIKEKRLNDPDFRKKRVEANKKWLATEKGRKHRDRMNIKKREKRALNGAAYMREKELNRERNKLQRESLEYREEQKRYLKKYHRENCDNLSDRYVIDKIIVKTNIDRHLVSTEMIELKRVLLQIRRETLKTN